MKPKTSFVIVSCFCLLLFFLLFSYKTTLFFVSKTSAQERVIHYLQGKEELSAGYTEPEKSHLNDVRKVMDSMDYLFYGLLFLLIMLVAVSFKHQENLRRMFLYGGIGVVIVVFLILALVMLSFDFSFTLFHELFFPQGNWQFAADSVLIQTFPLEFFVNISRIIFIQAFLLGSIFIVLSFYVRKWLISGELKRS